MKTLRSPKLPKKAVWGSLKFSSLSSLKSYLFSKIQGWQDKKKGWSVYAFIIENY